MSWEKVKLNNILSNSEKRFKPYDNVISGLKRIDKIDFGGNIYLSDSPSKTDMIIIKQGELVISGINVYKGAVALYEGYEDVTATIHYSSYKLNQDKIDLDFFKLFLKSPEFLNAIKEQVPGGIKTEIKPKHLLPLEVEIPIKVEEQKKIVKSFQFRKLNIDTIHSELSFQLDLVQQLRQAFLREAMQGKLVSQNPNDEPASILVQKIKAEKEKLAKEKKNKKEKNLSPIKDEEIPFEIPESWVWCKLWEIISFGPVNGYSPQKSKVGKGIKCLTLTATTSGKFNGSYFKLVDEHIDQDSYLWLSSGDILLQRGNSLEYVGIAALFNGHQNEFIYPDLMIKVKAIKYVDSKYLYMALNSPSSRRYFQREAFGTQKSMPKINQYTVNNVMIPIPPCNEQHRIVSKLDQLMSMCDELEQSIQQGKTTANYLLQRVLKEALQK
ncbi:MAG: restriction endonuclease subunit S [Desulfobacterales bacterium]|nr:restriction endonuclease subunit S [Desulfobacterales bacterium]